MSWLSARGGYGWGPGSTSANGPGCGARYAGGRPFEFSTRRRTANSHSSPGPSRWDRSRSGASRRASWPSPARFLSPPVGFRPGLRILEERPDPLDLVGGEVLHRLRGVDHGPPGREGVERDAGVLDDLRGLGEDPVVKHDHRMFADAAGGADRVEEVHLAPAVGREILDEQHLLARLELAFDLLGLAHFL